MLYSNNIYCSCLSKMDQPESVILLLSWKSTMTSLSKLNRSERLFWWYQVWNLNHCSHREEKYVCICIFPLPQVGHLTKEEHTGYKTTSCLPVDKTDIARPTCMTLWFRMNRSRYGTMPWENKIPPSHQIRHPGTQVPSLAQKPGPSAVVGEYEEVHQSHCLPKPFCVLPSQGPSFCVEQHLDFVFHWFV